jgi:uncharacterized membrane protein
MLAIDLARIARQLPLVILIGLVLMAAGALLDVVIQGTASHHAHHEGFGGAHIGPVVAVAGMVLVFLGVVAHGVRSHRRPGAATHGGLDHDADR